MRSPFPRLLSPFLFKLLVERFKVTLAAWRHHATTSVACLGARPLGMKWPETPIQFKLSLMNLLTTLLGRHAAGCVLGTVGPD